MDTTTESAFDSTTHLRFNEMKRGAMLLKVYLENWVESGIIHKSPDSLASDLKSLSERMVDFKSGTLAKKIRLTAELAGLKGAEYPEYLLHRITEWYIYSTRICQTDVEDFGEVRSWLEWAGWNYRKDQLMKLPSIREDCQVVGIQKYKEEALRVYKTWFVGLKSGHIYVHIEYLPPLVKADYEWVSGKVYSLKLIEYPGVENFRILILERSEAYFGRWPFPHRSIRLGFEKLSEMYAVFPLYDELPLFIGPVELVWHNHSGWEVYDASGKLEVSSPLNRDGIFSAFKGTAQTHLFGWVSDSKLFTGSLGFNGEFIKI